MVCDITGKKKVNMVGFCVGGTLLSTATAYLRAKKDTRIESLTLLTTLLDFSEPGEIGNYLTEDALPVMEQNADIKGIYDGRILGLSFSLLRENNLFWSYFIITTSRAKTLPPLIFYSGTATPPTSLRPVLSNTSAPCTGKIN